jgi:hypothetical protein
MEVTVKATEVWNDNLNNCRILIYSHTQTQIIIYNIEKKKQNKSLKNLFQIRII